MHRHDLLLFTVAVQIAVVLGVAYTSVVLALPAGAA
jgi:hypothetical protein